MGDLVLNIAKGRVAEQARRVINNDPTQASIVVVALNAGTTTDASFRDFDTLAACLPGAGGAAEVTNTNYVRKVLDQTAAITFAPDDTNDRTDVVIPDLAWTAIAAGTAWTDLLICYRAADADADSAILPMTLHDFAITPDGSDINADVGASGFFRAS